MKIGVFIGNINQKYEKTIIKSMENYAGKRGITLYIFGIFTTSGDNVLHAEGEKSILQFAGLRAMDGIIVAGDTLDRFGMQEELMERLKKEAKCPVVSLRSMEEDYYNILVDNETAMYEMTKHFTTEHGFRDICFVTGKMSMVDARERLSGYCRAMDEAGIPVTDDMLYYGDYWRKHGADIVEWFLKDRKNLPEAIICSNDYMALSVCEELEKRNIRIPEDICISGVDDVDEAQIHRPPLTTIRVPFEEMAEAAMEAVCRLAEGKAVECSQRLRLCNKYRMSCGCSKDDRGLQRDAYVEELFKYRYMIKECIYMSTDFESALSEEECLKWAADCAGEFEIDNCFICMKRREKREQHVADDKAEEEEILYLRHYMDENKESVFAEIPFIRANLLPDEFVPMLEKKSNIFIPLHCKDEIYGYFIFQLKDGAEYVMDEKLEFLCMNMGNALKKNYMYHDLFSMNDIMQLYLKDPLTSIYNRRGFERKMAELSALAEKSEESIAVVSLDMDGLKYINDNFGHVKGDETLMRFSSCLEDALEADEFCARMGGDEFEAVLLLSDKDRIERFQALLADRISRENKLIEEDYEVAVSVGIALVTKKEDYLKFMQLADTKMYENKRSKVRKQGKR